MAIEFAEARSLKPKNWLPWWKTETIYQVYPRSFAATGGKEMGDINGITSKLGYLKNTLGVGAIWISPVYPSPMRDGGYDVSDYYNVDPRFGTLQDMDNLLMKANTHGMRVIMDLVANHTSDQHPWFEQSLKRTDGKDDWYIWRDGRTPGPDGEPPNNWRTFFDNKSAWTYYEERQQWNFHKFLPEQPDLNMWNTKVQDAVINVMRFWLDKGVSGFRLDVFDHLFEEPSFRDMKPNPNWQKGQAPIEQLQWQEMYLRPEVYQFAQKIRSALSHYDDREIVLLGENNSNDLDHIRRLYGENRDGLHMPSNLRLCGSSADMEFLKMEAETYLSAIADRGWPNWVLGNHDNRRLVSRAGQQNARLAAMFLLTVRGTPIIYNGDEIGMTDGVISPHQMRDEQGINLGAEFSRDLSRTPMQWNSRPGTGFTHPEMHDKTWLPINPNYREINVEDQLSDPNSILNLHRRLLALRKFRPVLISGDFEQLESPENVMVYVRTGMNGDRILVGLNGSGGEKTVLLPGAGNSLVASDGRIPNISGNKLKLEPKQGVVVNIH